MQQNFFIFSFDVMSARRFVWVLFWINFSFILIVGLLNYIIDGDSSHHLPKDYSIFPRTTNHSALSKLHYIYQERPEVVYFGSSRVEIGLPAKVDLFDKLSVYNSGLSANNWGDTMGLMLHVLGGYTPKVIVLGVDLVSFTTKTSPLSNLDLSLLSSDFTEYHIKRMAYDIKRSLTIEASEHSIRSIQALLSGNKYDQIDEPGSLLGQTTEAEMLRLTLGRGRYIRAFQRKLQFASGPPPTAAEIREGMKSFEAFVSTACNRNITVRVFINPRHALAEYMLFQNGYWPLLEDWKVQLAEVATRYHSNCDFKIYDFSGYNSITTEPLVTLTPTSGLINYWEAAHYKSKVGNLIINRIFPFKNTPIPSDFGMELRDDTVSSVNSLVRRELSSFSTSHAREIIQANEWVVLDRKR